MEAYEAGSWAPCRRHEHGAGSHALAHRCRRPQRAALACARDARRCGRRVRLCRGTHRRVGAAAANARAGLTLFDRAARLAYRSVRLLASSNAFFRLPQAAGKRCCNRFTAVAGGFNQPAAPRRFGPGDSLGCLGGCAALPGGRAAPGDAGRARPGMLAQQAQQQRPPPCRCGHVPVCPRPLALPSTGTEATAAPPRP